ncbi:MAG: GNAT family N-acetyltransferase [Hyphomonadaceae bacterium]
MAVIRNAQMLDALGIARVHVRTWKEAYKDLLDPGYLASLTEARVAARWRRVLAQMPNDLDEAVFVVESGGQIVGFSSVGANREPLAPWDGEITMIYVLDSYRGRGFGRSLLKASADHCIRRGLFTAGLWVLADNSAARAFYETLGGRQFGQKQDAVGPRLMPLVGYGWDDIAALAQRTPDSSAVRRF